MPGPEIRELTRDTDSGEVDFRLAQDTVRVFMVNLPARAVADTRGAGISGQDPNGLPLSIPPTNSQHPNRADMRLDTWRIRAIADNIDWTEVRCPYSTDRRHAPPRPPDDLDPAFNSYSTTFVLEEIPMLILKLSFFEVNGVVDGTIKFEESVEVFQERRLVVQVRVNVEPLNAAQVNIMSEQIDKIHDIGGTLWRLEGADSNQEAEDRTAITYSWVRDQGTPVPEKKTWIVDGLPDRIIPDSDSEPAIYRKPFHRLLYVGGDAFTNGTMANRLQGEEDLNGWANLPGNPIRI